ncbi:MAG: hypothetical protein L0Z53_04490 [Acidobacteriales bacterium]|nr:hypothetical protein [Terriglobales bacterium]
MAEPNIVERDVQCVRCGYNLKSLLREGACPECGTAIEQSLHGDLLRYADQDWVKQVARGLVWVRNSRRWMFWMVIGLLLFAIVGMFVFAVGKATGVDTALEQAFEVVAKLIGIAIVFMPVGMGVGMWMVSRPEPRAEADDPHLHAMIRALSIGVIAAFAVWMMNVNGRYFGATNVAVQQVVFHACFLIAWLHAWVAVRQARMLAARCLNFRQSTAQQLRGNGRMGIAAPVVFLLLYWIGPFRRTGGAGWSMPGPKTMQNMFYLSVLAWLTVTGVYTMALELIREELVAASGGSQNNLSADRD